MSLQLQPKIKQHQACSECGGELQHVIEIFNASKDVRGVANATPAKKDLCGYCVVGHDVPVRMQTEEWAFGEVTRYDSSKLPRPFLVSFPDGSVDWLDITRRPFVDYLAFIHHSGRTQQAVGAELDEFVFKREHSSPQAMMPDSLSTFSSSSSIGTFELTAFGPSVFPLFNGDKLFDVEDLVFVDEDVVMQDSLEESSEDVSALTQPEDTVEKPPIKRKESTEDIVEKPPMKKKPKTRAIRSPKHWTKHEDQLLLKIMDSYHKQGIKPKWPKVAEQIETRNGKQCRERYVNHLSNTLKPKIWACDEDALIIHLFFKHGTKWSQICRLGFVGRTDNGIKNRFHHLRRWLEKDYRKKYDPEDESMSSGDDMAASMHQKVRRMIADIASDSKGGLPKDSKYNFGKLKKVKRITSCKRCCLFVPSAHCGDKICSVTGFCESCVSIPTYVMGDDLRACLTHRMALDHDFMLE